MSKPKLVIQHDLSKMSAEQLHQYLRDVSEFIGLDPDLNALDTIWMDNEQGPGKSLVIYARRGTAEVLRNKLGINVTSLTDKMVNGSIVFTATGKNEIGRQEIATGSKHLGTLTGKALDDSIMTASTRAQRRLTMQFTSLGILDESELRATVADLSNPASQVTLSGSPMVIPPAPVSVNNAPGRDVTPTAAPPETVSGWTSANMNGKPYIRDGKVLTPEEAQNEFVANQARLSSEAAAFLKTWDEVAVQPAVEQPEAFESSPEEPTRPRRARRQKNTVNMDVEPETVSKPAPVDVPNDNFDGLRREPIQAAAAAPPQAHSVAQIPPTEGVSSQTISTPVPTTGTSVPNQGTDFLGKPTDLQMSDYRKRVSVYTSELPSSEGIGSVQKMRAFITKTSGTAPQFMSTAQWDTMLVWFESFVTTNTSKGLVKYINDSLGVK
jgi:hypothetical protein